MVSEVLTSFYVPGHQGNNPQPPAIELLVYQDR
jgi:hypothetical protein